MKTLSMSLFIILSWISSQTCQAEAVTFHGRLFTSLAEREQMDAAKIRLSTRPPQQAQHDGQSATKAQEELAPAEQIELKGIIHKSGERYDVWLNDRHIPVTKPATYGRYTIKKINAQEIQLSSKHGQVVRLKTGQQFDPIRGSVIESFNSLGR